MDNQEPIKNAQVETPEVEKPKDTKSFCKCKPKTIKVIVVVVGVLLIILLSFAAGAGIALRKARFNCFRGQGQDNFMGPQMMDRREGGPMGFLHEFEGRDFRNGHGLAGTVTSISDNTFVVKDRDNKETTVVAGDQTIIQGGRDTLKITDLKQNDQIIVMGKPGDNGVINATLIRVFPTNQGNQNN
jgi:hypothetical protein